MSYRGAYFQTSDECTWIKDTTPLLKDMFSDHLHSSFEFMGYFCSRLGRGGHAVIFPLTKSSDSSLVPNEKQKIYIHAHSMSVTDLQFSPFRSHVLATGGWDMKIRIWDLSKKIDEVEREEEEEESEIIFGRSDCVGEFVMHQKISLLRWHPTSKNILSGSVWDKSLNIWDIEKPQQKNIYNFYRFLDSSFMTYKHSSMVTSFDWDTYGNYLAFTSFDNKLHLLDPRTNIKRVFSTKNRIFSKFRSQRCKFLKDKNLILVSGKSRIKTKNFHFMSLYDPRKLISSEEDEEEGMGPVSTWKDEFLVNRKVMVFYDEYSELIFACPRGYDEVYVMDTRNSDLKLIEKCRIGAFTSSNYDASLLSITGMTMLSKTTVDRNNLEIANFFVLNSDICYSTTFGLFKNIESYRGGNAQKYFPEVRRKFPSNSSEDFFSGSKKEMKPPSFSESRVCRRDLIERILFLQQYCRGIKFSVSDLVFNIPRILLICVKK